MTCIVGVKDKNSIVIAGDRMASDGHRKANILEPKVFRVGDFVFGCTTSFRMIDLLKYSLCIPDRVEGLEDEKYLRVDFVSSLKMCLSDGGFGVSSGDWKGGEFLFSYRGRLYVVEHDYQVREIHYGSVGSGMDVANGYIFAFAENGIVDDAERVARGAIMAASNHICSVTSDCDIIRIDI